LARFRDSHSGVPREKSHLDVGPVERSRVYYKGEDGGFPQVWAVVSLVCPCCSWLVLAPKVLQLRTNHFVWVVCRPVWVSEACQLFLVPSRSSNTPLYPSKCCELGSVSRFLPLLLSFTWTHIWVLQGVGSASYMSIDKWHRYNMSPWNILHALNLRCMCFINQSIMYLYAYVAKVMKAYLKSCWVNWTSGIGIVWVLETIYIH
jgi:hypothetical protein